MASPFVVGIDLGTTNTCLAWTKDGAPITIFPITQQTPEGRAERAILPSVLYAPLAEERGPELAGQWESPFCDPPWITGELAKARGHEVPLRAVTSAKSWLSHPSNDPDAPILPFGAAAGAPRLSPIDASARILTHVARAFEQTTRTRVESAQVVLTLPASFDEGARAATLIAAQRAGLKPLLLEEPQAAFYDFMARAGALEGLLGKKKHALVLVVDVGGGTTDLSLVSVERRGTEVTCTRIATGDHLLLGGDNMDLALAAIARVKLEEQAGEALDTFRMGQLLMACRAAKEALLAEEGPDAVPIAIASRGARLVGATVTTRLSKAEAKKVLLEGFFPRVEAGRLPPARRSALVGAGLPYARDPAITRHIARFLERYAEGAAPSAVLFNGGVFRSRVLRAAVVSAIRGRAGGRVLVLEESDPDLAVARGAAAHGLTRARGGASIRAGASRSYYVGVRSESGERAVCVVPRGTLEGVRCEVRAPVLKLRTGELSRFDLFRARTGVIDEVGAIVEPNEKSFARLRPLMTRAFGASGQVDVILSGELTPVGTLDLSLREVDGKKRSFSLEFQIGARKENETAAPREASPSAPRAPIVASPRLKQAEALLAGAFSFTNKDGRAAQGLVRELEKLLGERLSWNVLEARRLFDVLLEKRGARRWTIEHERAFWSLAGLCLRPGFGAPGDDARTRELFSLFSQRVEFGDKPPVAQAVAIAWRRVAPGLAASEQRTLFDALFPQLEGERGRSAAEAETRELLSWLERVDVGRKEKLGHALAREATRHPTPPLFVALSRIAARVPVYGATRDVVPPAIVEAWLAGWPAPALDLANASIQAAIVRAARVTGAITRDLSQKTRRSLAKSLIGHGATAEMVRPLKELVPVDQAVRGASFGEALPPGLTLDASE